MSSTETTPGSTRVVLALGTAQTLAWASSYYVPAILAVPMARDLGISTSAVFGTFSASLVLSALLGPRWDEPSTCAAGAACWHSPTWCWRRGSAF